MGPAAGALIRTVAWGPALAGIPHTGQEDPMNACAAGIDVGKSFFDVGMAPSGHNFRVPNAPKGVAVVIGRLRRSRVRRVVLEAIGPYGAALIAALRTSGCEVGVVNPRRIRAFRDAYLEAAGAQRRDQGRAVGADRFQHHPPDPGASQPADDDRHALRGIGKTEIMT